MSVALCIYAWCLGEMAFAVMQPLHWRHQLTVWEVTCLSCLSAMTMRGREAKICARKLRAQGKGRYP